MNRNKLEEIEMLSNILLLEYSKTHLAIGKNDLYWSHLIQLQALDTYAVKTVSNCHRCLLFSGTVKLDISV